MIPHILNPRNRQWQPLYCQ